MDTNIIFFLKKNTAFRCAPCPPLAGPPGPSSSSFYLPVRKYKIITQYPTYYVHFLSRTVFLFLLTSLDCCCCWILLSSMSLPVESSMDMMPGGFFLEGASSFSGTAGSSLLKRRTKVVQMTYFNEKCPNLFFFFLGCGFSGDFSWKIRKIIGVCI